MDKNISFTLKVWRQKGPKAKGAFETYQRTPARTCDRCYYLPDVYASLQRWRHHHS